ncbi:MAG: WecB/TagA/CpsF family glycosyltransferase [Syntrophaceae bacterium]|nr:WecB/TagA/CpsF family glycosyltransferase [Syntrophaceae bacterium]
MKAWFEADEKRKFFACANPHSLEVAVSDPLFRAALCDADLLTPDGIGIVIASVILCGSIRERITGSDMFYGVTDLLNQTRGKVFFLGSTIETLAQIQERISKDFPGITAVGTYSPPFQPVFSNEENSKIVSKINQARPDVLWVGMTAPKQEKWIHANLPRLDVKFVGAIGAVFDFYGGRIKRSNPVFQRLGLEWLPRLLGEPRRLWRRNFVSNPMFLMRIIQQRFKSNNLKDGH